MNPERVPGSAIRETRYGRRKPRRSRGTGILHQAGALRMLESTLGLGVVVEAEFVDSAVVDGPRVGDVPLLKALFGGGSEAGDVGPRGLKLGKRRDERVVIEIVIETQILLVVDTMV